MKMRSKRSKIFSSCVTAMIAAFCSTASLRKQVHDDLGALGIERRRRLVGENDARPVGERAGDGDALRLAAGKLRRHGVLAVADLEIVEQLDGPLSRVGGIDAGQMQHERDIVGGIEERQQVVELEDEPDLFEPQPAQVAAQPACRRRRARRPALMRPPTARECSR